MLAFNMDTHVFKKKSGEAGCKPYNSGTFGNDPIAVVGMSCRVAGADDVDGFWTLLCEGNSQHQEIPEARIRFNAAYREANTSQKWFGNFLSDVDAFDHKFFNKSPREMSSTDPQQRLMLQAAYQAIEQSGYFQCPDNDKKVGCYIGVGLVDYEQNVACHQPNAYTATGNLRSFVAGKISHHFGWTGPGLTIDTACSSSGIAIHQACQGILTGDCNAALVGGVSVMTDPLWFQNLAAASFLSRTGNCKPFDANADGYGRGEGVGAVFLKKLSTAIQDGNQVLGVISGTAVSQSINCTPVTCPNVGSLTDLFQTVTSRAGLDIDQISVVEAHGTGTPVGDPVEYAGISQAFRSSSRQNTVSLGSVKGLVGHTETASGVISLVKILLMLHWAKIPPQASFSKLTPSIGAPSDRLEVTERLKGWDVEFRAALINNYGASGSNASMILTEPPVPRDTTAAVITSYPFWVCGQDAESVRSYCGRLRRLLEVRKSSKLYQSLRNLSYNLSRQSNRTLSFRSIFSCCEMSEFHKKLSMVEQCEMDIAVRQPTRPLIFCFGGQVSTSIGLDKQLYEHVAILRHYLDRCNAQCISLRLPSIYPGIFADSPELDVVQLQIMLFAFQWSCAKAWMDCGAVPTALVGHSFGELTALCISGVLSLSDALVMISQRARTIQDSWNGDKGAMMMVEGDLGVVERLLESAKMLCDGQEVASIACYNGPTNFTLAGSTRAVDTVIRVAEDDMDIRSKVKIKRLNVSHAFHSNLMDPLEGKLKQIGEKLAICSPVIALERATKHNFTDDRLSADFVATHARHPVYFADAVQRLAKKHPSSIWLEIGSQTNVTSTAKRTFNTSERSHFQSINITNSNAMQHLTDATVSLWKEGLRVSFWSHHPLQASQYSTLLLPPYQFRKFRHWLEIKNPARAIEPAQRPNQIEHPPMWTFLKYDNEEEISARFRIETLREDFQGILAGHVLVDTAAACHTPLQIKIAIEALSTLRPRTDDHNTYQSILEGLTNHAPICVDPSRTFYLDAQSVATDKSAWKFKIVSQCADETSTPTLHTDGVVSFRSMQDKQTDDEFDGYERLCNHSHCLRLLHGENTTDAIQGRSIYRAFANLVDYGRNFQCLQKIVGRPGESAGRVHRPHSAKGSLDPLLMDNFCQVAGIYLNCLTDLSRSEVYVSTGIKRWLRSPKFPALTAMPKSWDVFALHHASSDDQRLSDVFVFDPDTGSLLEIIVGVRFRRLLRSSLVATLTKALPSARLLSKVASRPILEVDVARTDAADFDHYPLTTSSDVVPDSEAGVTLTKASLYSGIKKIVGALSDIDPTEIKDDADLSDLGIDSLMGMELSYEMKGMFECSLETIQSALVSATTVQNLAETMLNMLRKSSKDGYIAHDASTVDSAYQSVESSPQSKDAEFRHSNEHHNDDKGLSVDARAATDAVSPRQDGNDVRFNLSQSDILTSFRSIREATDEYIEKHQLSGYMEHVVPRQTELCITYIVEAFERLGRVLKDVLPGQKVPRISHDPKHSRFVQRLYEILESNGNLLKVDDGTIKRTATPCPNVSTDALYHELLTGSAHHANEHKLIQLAGSKLADCLIGKEESVNVLFGTAEVREVLANFYTYSPINLAFLSQLESFLCSLLSQIRRGSEPIKIFEMGAGTGATATWLVSMLVREGIHVEYTFSDISSSLVAAARRRFSEYPFVRFRTHDISKAPPSELLHSQDIVISTNGVHATPDLCESTRHIREVLRPGGFLLLLEVSTNLPWFDLVFGMLEGWWLFDDGRTQVEADERTWERSLKGAGYEVVEWTIGQRPEASLQRIFIAM